MVMANSGQNVMQLPQVLEYRHADLDVRLDLLVLFGCEGPGFLENAIVDADLADVV